MEGSVLKIEALQYFDSSPIKNDNEDFKIEDQTLNDIKDAFKSDLSQNAAKKKKKKLTTPMAVLDKDKCGDEEVKILLNIVNNMLKCLKSTLPAILSPELNTFGNINKSISYFEN